MSCVLRKGVAHGNAKHTANTNHDRRLGARFDDRKARLVDEYFRRLREADRARRP